MRSRLVSCDKTAAAAAVKLTGLFFYRWQSLIVHLNFTKGKKNPPYFLFQVGGEAFRHCFALPDGCPSACVRMSLPIVKTEQSFRL